MGAHPTLEDLVPDDDEPTTERLDLDDRSGSATSYLNYLFHLASCDFTAGAVPEWWRITGLDGPRRISGRLGSLRSAGGHPVLAPSRTRRRQYRSRSRTS
jgi:hypothetical protein